MVNLESIEAAANRIMPSIYESPLVHSRTLSALTGNDIFLKLDNLQMTGSFKERGALNRILTMTDDEKRRGVVAASAGNHAQAVAYHAAARGIPAQIWMPRYTPLIKLGATRGYGAEVILHGASYDEAYERPSKRACGKAQRFYTLSMTKMLLPDKEPSAWRSSPRTRAWR